VNVDDDGGMVILWCKNTLFSYFISHKDLEVHALIDKVVEAKLKPSKVEKTYQWDCEVHSWTAPAGNNPNDGLSSSLLVSFFYPSFFYFTLSLHSSMCN
jgi:hypothetical protein